MTGRQPEALRADAQQNRERILRAAKDALASSSDASLNSIAKMAGVGPGTLYRHFPNREALILAAYRYEVELLADAAAKLLGDHAPIEALRLWFDQLAPYGMINSGLAGVLDAATSDGLAGESYEPVIGAITLLLRACTEDGSIRAGLDAGDVLLLLGFLWRIDPGPGAEARTARLLDFVVDGLRAGAPNERPAGAKRPRSRSWRALLGQPRRQIRAGTSSLPVRETCDQAAPDSANLVTEAVRSQRRGRHNELRQLAEPLPGSSL